MNSAPRRYTRNLIVIFALYGIALFVSNIIDVSNWHPNAQLVLAVSPAIAAALLVPAILSFVSTLDEFQRRVISESCLVSMVVVGLSSFAYSFVQGAHGLPEIGLVWVWPALIGVAGLAQIPVRIRLG